MTKEEAKKEISRLSELIDYYNELYYQKSQSEITDYDFDKLLAKLIELESSFPEFKSPSSQIIGRFLYGIIHGIHYIN